MKNAQIASIYDSMNARSDAARKAAATAATKEEELEEKLKADTEQALGIKELAEQLLVADGLDAAVGFGLRKSLVGSLPFTEGEAYSGSKRADFEAMSTRLANLLTLDNLDLMSGVLSETDIKILETAGSNLKNYQMSETAYREEVGRIIEVATRTIDSNGITEEQAAFWGVADQTDLDEVNSIYN